MSRPPISIVEAERLVGIDVLPLQTLETRFTDGSAVFTMRESGDPLSRFLIWVGLVSRFRTWFSEYGDKLGVGDSTGFNTEDAAVARHRGLVATYESLGRVWKHDHSFRSDDP